MKIIIQFLIILVFSFIGELLRYIIPLPIPASIYGILLLFLALKKKWVKVDSIREVGMFLLAVMPVTFIPSASALVDNLDLIRNSLFQYLTLIIVSTIVTMACTGLVTQYVIKRGKEKKQ